MMPMIFHRKLSSASIALKAKESGANAIIMVRFSTSEIMKGSAELLSYGTAVIVEDE